jgi:decaprenylphospho-beta-D-ribofuranose 2-oxidase
LAIGARRSYGDACVNPEGSHISTDRLSRIEGFDRATGTLTCGAGVTLQRILELVHDAGWFLRVVPGTMLSSIGGAVACDVHGKGHHGQGSFSTGVISFELITASRESYLCSRQQNPELFWATAGGLGQTGIITRVTLQLERVESSYILTQHFPTRDLSHTLQSCAEQQDQYSVCWIDSLARGKRLGRGVLMLGHHATALEFAGLAGQRRAFTTHPRAPLSLPVSVPRLLTGAAVWKLFNAGYYTFQSRSTRPFLAHYAPYFFPLDGVAHWNRIYGRRGFIEYQFAVPLESAESVCREVLERLSESGNGSFLAVLKRLGNSNPAPLSFPIKGVTLAVDMPFTGGDQMAVLAHLDNVVAKAGGRIYLVKDSCLDPSFVSTMYPRRQEWASFVNRYDPEGLFTSSLVRRLKLRAEIDA